jgi:hypothetical protein
MNLYYEKLTRHTETGIYFFSYRLIYPAKFCPDRPSQTSAGKPTKQIASKGNRKFKYLNLKLETGQIIKLTLQKRLIQNVPLSIKFHRYQVPKF